MWSFNVKSLAPIELPTMYILEVLQVDRKAKEPGKKQVDARRHDQIDKTKTPKEKRKKKGKEKQLATRLKVCTEREEEREIKKIDITHPHQGPP